MLRAFLNTALVLIVVLTVSVFIGSMLAYVLNRFKFKGLLPPGHQRLFKLGKKAFLSIQSHIAGPGRQRHGVFLHGPSQKL